MADGNVNCCTRIGRMLFSKGIVMRYGSMASVFLGIGAGVLLKSKGPLTIDNEIYLRIPTAVVMRTISVMVCPLIMSNVIIGFSRSNMSSSRKINLRALTYFVLSTILSMLLGLLLVCLVQPGADLEVIEIDEDDDNEVISTIHSISDLFKNIFPKNILMLGFKKFKTVRVMGQPEANSLSESILKEATRVQVKGEYVNGPNILGLLVVSFITVMFLRRAGEERVLFVDQVIILNNILKSVLKLLMCLVPVGLGPLIVLFICKVEYRLEVLISLGKFFATVIGGLVIHGAVVLPLIYLVCTRRNPFHVIRGTYSAFLRVLLLSSSDLVSRVRFCCEEVITIDTRITRFMLPIGLSFNMNGTAFYEMAVVVFVTQLNGLTVDWAYFFIIAVTVMLTTAGEAGIPGTGTVTTFFILSATGVLETNAALPLVVEWLIYFFTPVVNVLGNCFGMALVNHLSKEELENMDEESYGSAVSNASSP